MCRTNSSHAGVQCITVLLNSCHSITFEFSKRVITCFIRTTDISEPQLHHRKVRLFCQKTAVFTPNKIVFGTVATAGTVCTCVGHPACALVQISWRGSTPIRHSNHVTWYPTAIRVVIFEKNGPSAFVFAHSGWKYPEDQATVEPTSGQLLCNEHYERSFLFLQTHFY